MSESGTPMRIAAGRWVRHTFVWDNLISALKTFAWLGPLTLLIWVLAERAQVVEVDNIAFPIAVRSADPNRFVQLRNDPGVIAKFRGPRSRIEALRQSIRPAGDEPAVVINVDPKLPLGANPLDAIAYINQTDPFRYSGVNITEVQPPLLQVLIDSFEDREVDVRVPPSVRNLEELPVFSPARVRVRAPSRALEAASITVEADLASSRVLDRTGTWPTTVPVYSPELDRQEGVTYIPETVTTTLHVGESSRTIGIPSVVVKPWPPGGDFIDRFRIVADPWAVYGLKITGPPDQIAQIERNEVLLSALVDIKGSDAPTDGNPSRITRAVEIKNLPEGVAIETPPNEFTFSIVPRTAQ